MNRWPFPPRQLARAYPRKPRRLCLCGPTIALFRDFGVQVVAPKANPPFLRSPVFPSAGLLLCMIGSHSPQLCLKLGGRIRTVPPPKFTALRLSVSGPIYGGPYAE